MTPLVSELIGLAGDIDFTWFDVGHIPPISDMGSEAAIRHSPLPFEKCAVCGVDADGHKFLLLLISNEPVTLVNGKPVLLPGGKIGKPEGWQPPNLADFV